ncbi:MAG TPA: 50S ribosomal protein L3 [Dehalococcoidia bacterium]|nr:50S ribosomal protein L3 [Dehalococcoidia bacterium]
MSIEGVLGTKLGSMQVFDPDGTARQVTVIEVTPNVVVQVKTAERDGYEAVQLAYGQRKRVNQPLKGHFRGLGRFRYLREFRVDNLEEWETGKKVGADIFKPGDLVDVTGISKGRGFAGVMKRHGFRGGPRTHGQSDRARAPGSIGAGTDPGRVIKGRKMAGHMGTTQATVKNLLVVNSDAEKGILMVQGSVPGNTGELVKVRFANSANDRRRKRASRYAAAG